MANLRRISRTMEKVLNLDGGITFTDFEAFLAALGFVLKRQAGSHRIYVHPNVDRPFPIQPDGKDAKRYQIRELRDMIRKYGLSLDASE